MASQKKSTESKGGGGGGEGEASSFPMTRDRTLW